MSAWTAIVLALSVRPSLLSPTLAELQAADSPQQSSSVSNVRPVKRYRSRGWSVEETANFRVWLQADTRETRQLARLCESIREQLQAAWLGEASDTAWTPKCDIVVHASAAGYCRCLGSGAAKSVGCAAINVDGERVVCRRIDLRADAADWRRAALPHELTHIVLADRFAGRYLPRWADEGMGVLAESHAKQWQRARALRQASARGTVYRTDSLLMVTTYPPAAYRDAFYGQSAGLVRFLVERGKPAQFVEFLEQSLDADYDVALRRVYKIGGVQELARLAKTERSASQPAVPEFSRRISRLIAASPESPANGRDAQKPRNLWSAR